MDKFTLEYLLSMVEDFRKDAAESLRKFNHGKAGFNPVSTTGRIGAYDDVINAIQLLLAEEVK